MKYFPRLPIRLNHSRRVAAGYLLGVGLVAMAPISFGQSAKSGATPPSETADSPRQAVLSPETLQQSLDEAKEDASLDDPTKSAVTSSLETALARLKSAAEYSARMDAFRLEFDQAPKEVARIRQELADRKGGKAPPGSPPETPLPADATAEAINARLTAEKAQFSDLGRVLREWEDQLTAIAARPTAIRERLAEARPRSTEAELALSAWKDRPAATSREKADHAVAQAAHISLRREVDMLEQESLSLDLRRGLLEARRDLAASDLALARERITRLEARADAMVNARIGEAERLVGEAELESVRENAPVRELMDATKRLSEETQALLEKIRTTERNRGAMEAELNRLRRDSDNIRAQIEIGDLGDSFAQVVLELRQKLPSGRDYRLAKEERHNAISNARLASFRADRELESLPPADVQRDQILASVEATGLSEAATKELRPIMETLIDARMQLLSGLAEDNRRLSRQLGEVDLVEGEIVTLADDLQDYLGEKLLWVASSPPLTLSAVTGLGPALTTLAGPSAIRQYGTALSRLDWPQRLLAAATLVVLILPRRRLRAFLVRSGTKTRRLSTDGMANTFQALSATLYLALPLPIAMWLFGSLLIAAASGLEAAFALGEGMKAPAPFLLAMLFSSVFCRPGGVAQAHFRWDAPVLGRLRTAIHLAAAAFAPSLGLMTFWLNCKEPAHFQGPGRVVFLISMLLTSAIASRLLTGTQSILNTAATSPHWMIRLRRFWVPLVVGLPLALGILALLGHFLTAVALAYQFQLTGALILSGFLTYGVLTRWVILKERRIALREAIAEREARLRAARDRAVSDAQTTEPRLSDQVALPELEDEDDAVDIAVMGDQTRKLIRDIVTVGSLLAIWLTWSEVIPVLKYLDTRNLIGNVSLADLITVGLVVVIMTVLFQNLPGLLDVAFLRTLALESGLRNAIVTLCQYAVIAIGAALASHIVGLDWSKFGWIAAALSVGLGFGLQEVVANFVSGLILLFERPIRVGDTVTVAGVDGVVSKIRIRATTIMNWDRKEFVVPNKEFVTGTLLNWTLSSPVTRLVLPVGVAYGSDVDNVQKILIDIARSHHVVLADPSPLAVFEQFGDSTLNFSLRCFLPSPAERLDATHFINSEIYRRFAEAGVEISYPQRDLHIRSVHPSVRLGLPEAAAD